MKKKPDYINKNVKLSQEFTEYVINHPEVMSAIPKKAYIFFVNKKDADFSRSNIAIARKLAREKRLYCYKAEKKTKGWTVDQFDPAAV